MTKTLAIVGLLGVGWALPPKDERLAVSHPLSHEEIESALAIGNDPAAEIPSLSLGSSGVNWSGPRSDSNRGGHFFEQGLNRRTRSSGFGVELFTPYSWLAKVARDEKMKGRDMRETHVNEQLLAPLIRVLCYSDVPQELQDGAFGNVVESVSIRPTNKKHEKVAAAVQVTRIPERFRTPSGESVDVGPLLATFALADVLSISALDKKGEFYVAILAADGEEKDFKVKSKHFKMLP